MFIYYCYNIY